MTSAETPSGGDRRSDSAHGEPDGVSSGEIAAVQDADLADSLVGLSEIAVGRGLRALEHMLLRVAELAVNAIPGADGAGLTLQTNGSSEVIVVSMPFVQEVDDIQYGIGEGPCITAAAEGRTVRSGNLGTETAWPQFGPRVRELGVNSVLSLPLVSEGATIGAMNVYAHAMDAFDDRSVELGEMYAIPAAISVLNARALHDSQELVARLRDALNSRAVVDRAVGIIISRTGCSPEDAVAQLRAMSDNDQMKVLAVAELLLADATKRALSGRDSVDPSV